MLEAQDSKAKTVEPGDAAGRVSEPLSGEPRRITFRTKGKKLASEREGAATTLELAKHQHFIDE